MSITSSQPESGPLVSLRRRLRIAAGVTAGGWAALIAIAVVDELLGVPFLVLLGLSCVAVIGLLQVHLEMLRETETPASTALAEQVARTVAAAQATADRAALDAAFKQIEEFNFRRI